MCPHNIPAARPPANVSLYAFLQGRVLHARPRMHRNWLKGPKQFASDGRARCGAALKRKQDAP